MTRYVGGRFARGDPGAEFAGVPGRPTIISGNVARNGTFIAITIVDADGNIVATSINRPLPRFNVADHPAFRTHLAERRWPAPRQPADLRPVGRPERHLAHPPPEPSRRQLRGNHRDQHPARAVHRLLSRCAGKPARCHVGDRPRRDHARAPHGRVSSSGEDMRGRPAMAEQRRDPNGTSLGAEHARRRGAHLQPPAAARLPLVRRLWRARIGGAGAIAAARAHLHRGRRSCSAC